MNELCDDAVVHQKAVSDVCHEDIYISEDTPAQDLVRRAFNFGKMQYDAGAGDGLRSALNKLKKELLT